MSDVGYQEYCEKCGAPVVWCKCLEDIDWSLEMRTHIGMEKLGQQVKELRAENARRDEIIARLKEDAERLAKKLIVMYSDEMYECSYCGRGVSKSPDEIIHAPDCPITLHHALMKELE